MSYFKDVFRPKLLSVLKNYSKEQFGKDVVAGLIVAIIALPLSIALAIASGVPPERGIYTAIVAGFFISLLGGSRVQIGGPTAAFMVIIYNIVAEYGITGLTIATFMAGLMMIVFGLCKLGAVIKFIPYPITTGFTSGIAISIFVSQIKDFLGLTTEKLPGDVVGKVKVYASAISSVNWITLAIGAAALLILIFWPKLTAKIPAALIALVVMSAVVKLAGLDGVETIGSTFGSLSSKPPMPAFPSVTWDMIVKLAPSAFTIAFLGSIESLLSAVVSDGMIGSKHNSNTELIGQGVANMASALFGGIPATGAIARTVANIKNGGRTPVAGIVHALTLLVILVVFMPFAKMVPLAALAAVLIMVAYNMCGWREFAGIFKAPKSDVLVLLVTFFLTVFADLVVAIEVGIVLAAILFMKRMADVGEVKVRAMDEQALDEEDIDDKTPRKTLDNVLIYEINGPFFFGAADKFLAEASKAGKKTDVLIIKMKHVSVMDATGLQAFRQMVGRCKSNDITLILSGVHDQPLAALTKADLLKKIGEDHIFSSLTPAIHYVQENFVKTEKTANA